jgi:hypothetical protein
MAYHRTELNHDGIIPAAELRRVEDGTYARIAGAVLILFTANFYPPNCTSEVNIDMG